MGNAKNAQGSHPNRKCGHFDGCSNYTVMMKDLDLTFTLTIYCYCAQFTLIEMRRKTLISNGLSRYLTCTLCVCVCVSNLSTMSLGGGIWSGWRSFLEKASDFSGL